MTDKTMKCGHNVQTTELTKSDGIVYCVWICEEGCRASEKIGEAYQWDTTDIDEI